MGTARWEQETIQAVERDRIRAEVERKRQELSLAEAEASARIRVLERELEARRLDVSALEAEQVVLEQRWRQQAEERRLLRQADVATPPGTASRTGRQGRRANPRSRRRPGKSATGKPQK